MSADGVDVSCAKIHLALTHAKILGNTRHSVLISYWLLTFSLSACKETRDTVSL